MLTRTRPTSAMTPCRSIYVFINLILGYRLMNGFVNNLRPISALFALDRSAFDIRPFVERTLRCCVVDRRLDANETRKWEIGHRLRSAQLFKMCNIQAITSKSVQIAAERAVHVR